MDNFQTNMQDLIERRSEIGTTIFEEQHQELERQLAETKTQLTELQARYDKFPEEIRRSSAAKAEQIQQFQNHLTQGATYFFLFLVIFALILVGKKIRKFLGLTKKKPEETLKKIQEQVSAMNTELQVQKVAQTLEQIRQERLAKKTKKVKSQGEKLNVDEQSEKVAESWAEKESERDRPRFN
jgi:Na+-transporting methylmalonyl-CoA/oxaloacetate decarboxylase gamma subunit